ncbi:hypothetical protein EDD15DRAFT_2204310 [Pisolithus albus]|nr:hypothetical protein EDD15DRAFT_2204310 [Pisolithus albus]
MSVKASWWHPAVTSQCTLRWPRGESHLQKPANNYLYQMWGGISDADLEQEQQEFLVFLSDILCHMSFPWLDQGQIKKPETLIKKLTDAGLAKEWKWWDGDVSQQPTEEGSLVPMVVAMPISNKESKGNQNIHSQKIFSIQKLNHSKMKQVVNAVLTEGLGVDGNNKMVPHVREDLNRLLQTLKLYLR